MNKLVTALKENKNDIRKKVIIAAGVTVVAVTGAIVLSKMKDSSVDVLLLTEEAADSLTEALPTE